jgi:polysaccharide biosynthesis PFTS motif protein
MRSILNLIVSFFNFSLEPTKIRSLARVRNVMRGYRIMKKSDNPDLVRFINEQLSLNKIRLKKTLFSTYMLGYNSESIEIIYRQYILLYLTGTKLNATLLKHLSDKAPVIFPLPATWIYILKENGIRISKLLSKAFFLIFTLKQYILGVSDFLLFFWKNIVSYFRDKENKSSDFVYFMYLHRDCLPYENNYKNYNIIQWYLDWDDRQKDITAIHHGVKIADFNYKEVSIKYTSYIPVLEGLPPILIFGAWGIFTILASFINIVIGRFQSAILFREAVKRKIFSLSKNSSMAREYFFNNENLIYRPLWTYWAESQGSKITYYNWAASYGDFLGPRGYSPNEVGEKIQNWPQILQWSPSYGVYLRSILVSKNVKVEISPPVYYCDFGSETYESDKPLISVFDVTPQKDYFMDICVPGVEYRTHFIEKKFLEDIYDVAIQNGFNLLWKRKRIFSARHHKGYIKFSDEFSKRLGVIDANPRASAFRIVQNSKAVISMPFTSTAIIGEYFSKPSVYYDPAKVLYKEDRGAQGIQVLSGKVELEKWIQSLK